MKHSDKLIDRIIFLEGRPIVCTLAKITISEDPEKQIQNDRAAETDALKNNNASIRVAVEIGANGTRDLLTSILKDEEAHIDTLKAQQDQIRQLTLAGFLQEQV